MAAILCDACGGKMYSGLAACPHCGARRAVTAPPPKLSNDEIHALLATDPVVRDAEPRRGMFQALVLPHPATTGAARVAELVLTLLSLPLVVAGALTIGLTRRRSRPKPAASGELSPALAMTVFGGLALLGPVPVVLIGASVVALWARALIRSRAAGPGHGDLQRIDRPLRRPEP